MESRQIGRTHHVLLVQGAAHGFVSSQGKQVNKSPFDSVRTAEVNTRWKHLKILNNTSQSRYPTAIAQHPSEGFSPATTLYNSGVWLKNSASSCIFIQKRHSIWKKCYLQEWALREDNRHRKQNTSFMHLSVSWTILSVWILVFIPLICSALNRRWSKVHWPQ